MLPLARPTLCGLRWPPLVVPKLTGNCYFQIVGVVHDACRRREIASALYVSLNTVKTHARGIYRKLGVGTRDEAVARARDLGVL